MGIHFDVNAYANENGNTWRYWDSLLSHFEKRGLMQVQRFIGGAVSVDIFVKHMILFATGVL